MVNYKVLERSATHTLIEYPNGMRVRISNNHLQYTDKGVYIMTYYYLETLSGCNVTYKTNDDCPVDSRGFYHLGKELKAINPDIDWNYVEHDFKYRGLRADKKRAINTDTDQEIDLPDFKRVHVRKPINSKSDNWQEKANQWLVYINGESFDYYTGIGIKNGPSVLCVLHSLCMDASACEESYDDWCDSLGYDSDSRQALETYLQCQNNASKLRKAGVDVNAMQNFLQDY